MTTAVVWFRRDLRVHDLPALAEAAARARSRAAAVRARSRAARRALPLRGPHGVDARLPRTRSTRSCARAAAGSSCAAGRRRRSCPRSRARSAPTPSTAAGDASPASHARATTGWTRRSATCRSAGIPGLHRRPEPILTKDGRPFTVFSRSCAPGRAGAPLGRAGAPRDRAAARRDARPDPVAGVARLRRPARPPGSPSRPRRPRPEVDGALAARGVRATGRDATSLADATSRLSVTCASGRCRRCGSRSACRAAGGRGAEAYRSELAWRDFYAAVLLHHPRRRRASSSRSATATSSGTTTPTRSRPGRQGRTGYPARRRRACASSPRRGLDAQPRAHDRRLVPDQGPAPRLARRRGALHGAPARRRLGSNNGGWQWIASTGTDPAPYFRGSSTRRPSSRRFDPDGAYVRRWVPELARRPRRAHPRALDDDRRRAGAAGCVIGSDYPAPIVDHAAERRVAIERYRAA